MAKIETGSTIKRALIGLTAASTMALAACGSGASDPADAPAEDVIKGVTIENARLVLAPVAGNPAAVYFDFAYEGERAFSLGRVAVDGAESALMHQYGEYNFEVQMMEALPIPVTSGSQIEFKPGDLHVMAFDLSPELQAGGSTDVTLTVSGGRKHKFTADIRAAGDER